MLRETALDDNSWSRFQFSGGEFLPPVEPWEPGDFRANVSIVMMAVCLGCTQYTLVLGIILSKHKLE